MLFNSFGARFFFVSSSIICLVTLIPIPAVISCVSSVIKQNLDRSFFAENTVANPETKLLRVRFKPFCRRAKKPVFSSGISSGISSGFRGNFRRLFFYAVYLRQCFFPFFFICYASVLDPLLLFFRLLFSGDAWTTSFFYPHFFLGEFEY